MSDLDEREKWTVSILAGIIFFILCSPIAYQITNSFTRIFRLTIANEKGQPNMAGVVIHAFIFMIITKLLMN